MELHSFTIAVAEDLKSWVKKLGIEFKCEGRRSTVAVDRRCGAQFEFSLVHILNFSLYLCTPKLDNQPIKQGMHTYTPKII